MNGKGRPCFNMVKKERHSFFESKHFLKILSVFLALILWFFVAGDNRDTLGLETRRTFSGIPLVMRNVGADLVVVESVENVILSLQGVPVAFDGLTPADLEAYVDLSGRAEGWHEMRINAAAPTGVSVVRIEPARVNILLDDLISRQMGVEGIFQGEPAGGLAVHGSNFRPEAVFVQGPRRKVDLMEKVVFQIELEGTEDDIVARQVALYPVDSAMNRVEGLIVVPDRAEVWVQLGLPRREIPLKAVFRPEELMPLSIFLEPPSVELQGPRDILYAQTYISTETIDLEALGAGEGEHTFTVSLIIPEGLEAVSQSSVRVRLILGNKITIKR